MEELIKGKIDDFNEYSEEVNEVLSSTPNSLFFFGNTIIAVIIMCLLFLSWLIKFPDIIKTEAFLSSKHSPLKLLSYSNGNIVKLNIDDGAWVTKDSILAVITNNENLDDIATLQNIIEDVRDNLFSRNSSIYKPLPSNLKIGQFTATYAEIKSLYDRIYKNTNELSIGEEDKQVKLQIFEMENMKKKLQEQLLLLKNQIELIETNHKRQSTLLTDGVISQYDFEQSEFQLIDVKNQEKQINYRIIEIESNIQNVKRQQYSLITTEERGLAELRLEIMRLIEQLLAQIKLWEYNHVIKAPFTGTCSFISFMSVNQYVSEGQELFYLSPKDDSIELRGFLPIIKSGLVNSGQKVLIKVKSYPYKEFGTLSTTIDHISYMASENGYTYFAKINDRLITNYGKEIKYKPLMEVEAEIIVEDTRLIERIFNEIKNIFKN